VNSARVELYNKCGNKHGATLNLRLLMSYICNALNRRGLGFIRDTLSDNMHGATLTLRLLMSYICNALNRRGVGFTRDTLSDK